MIRVDAGLKISLFFIFNVLLVLFSQSASSIQLCSEDLEQFVIDQEVKGEGIIIRHQLFSTIPHVRTSFDQDGFNVRVPIRFFDFGEHGSEAVYFFDVSTPKHRSTEVYVLLVLDQMEASSLVSLKNASPYFSKVMGQLKKKYDWTPTGGLENGEGVEAFNDVLLQQLFGVGRVYRKTAFLYQDGVFLLVEYGDPRGLRFLIEVRSFSANSYKSFCKINDNRVIGR